jgi:hypothetical protein
MTDNRPNDEAALERDVRRTQDQMGDTVDRLEEKMNPREVTRSVIGDDGAEVGQEALEVTRRNPIPVALIAVGVIWLLATSRSPAIKRFTDGLTGKRSGEGSRDGLRPRAEEPAPIGPPPATGEEFDRRMSERTPFGAGGAD